MRMSPLAFRCFGVKGMYLAVNNQHVKVLRRIYLNNKSKVLIICSKHGEFWQRPDHHLKGHVCKKCGYETVASKQTYDLNEMIKSFCKIHNNKYNYDKIQKENYKTQFSYIEIFCPKHGIFKQKAYKEPLLPL